jgi:hypothetical protein
MARKKSYLPKADGQLVNWLNNLSSKIGGYAAKYGITPGEVSYIQAAALYFAYWFGVLDMVKANIQKLTKWKNEIRDGLKAGGSPAVTPTDISFTSPPAVAHGVLPFVRSIVNRIKAHQSYSDTDGEDLKIVGADDDTELSQLKPIFEIKLNQGQPELVWEKGITSGVKIHVNRNLAGTPVPPPSLETFQFLAIDTQPNYIDTFPLPPFGQSVVWAYVMVYMMGDEEVGEWSDPVLVTVKGNT